MNMHVVVIGGGVTGLAAARELRANDVAVTLIDRHFPLGGRFRPVTVDAPDLGRVTFDPFPKALGPTEYPIETPDAPLGFPALSLRRSLFPAENTKELVRIPMLRVAESGADTRAAFCTVPAGGARGLIDKLLPHGFDEHYTLRASTDVTALRPDGRGWCVRLREGDGTERTIRADAVLLTQPVPAALALLAGSPVTLPEAARDELDRLTYAPELSVLAAFHPGPHVPRVGLVTFADSPLACLLDNAATGASPRGLALTAIAAPEWTAQHFADEDEEILRQLLPLVANWVGAAPVWHTVVRRTHAVPRARVRMPFVEALDVPPLVVAGEAFAGYVRHTLDAAHTSAVHAVAHLRRTLTREARIAARPARTPAPAVIEAAVASADEADAAVRAGAGRLLLSAAPEVGGLTPTVDALRLVRSAVRRHTPRVPVTVLIRPRLGGHTYTPGELTQMRRDARRLLSAGADGLAFAVVRSEGGEVRVDRTACEPLLALARRFRVGAAFHGAFDGLTDRRTGLQELIALGFERVYTAGGRRWAADGVTELAAAVGYAGWDIDVVPAPVGPGIVGYVVAETGCRQVLVEARADPSNAATGAAPFACPDHTPLDTRAIAEAVAGARAGRDDSSEHEVGAA